MKRFEFSYKDNGEEELPYFCALSSMRTIGIKAYNEMQKYFFSPREVFTASDEARKTTGIFTESQLNEFREIMKSGKSMVFYEDVYRRGMRYLSCEDECFPRRLNELSDKPLGLFFYGELPEDEITTVGVIGARECSFYGEEVATIIGEKLGIYRIPVISGMARGIDSMSQMGALEKGGTSFGILGSGPDICYPRESRKLYEKLKCEGGIISEYPPGRQPDKVTFVRRNRIISGLSDALCVVEAKKKSGTLTTVDFALEQGKDVFAVPGRITDRTSYGCNELIRQGAEILTDLEELAKYLLLRNSGATAMKDSDINIEEKISFDEINYLERKIMRDLKEDTFCIGELFYSGEMLSYCTVSEAMTNCMNLSFAGYLSDLGAGRFHITPKGRQLKEELKMKSEEDNAR